MSNSLFFKGTFAILHAMTDLFCATKSNEYTLLGTEVAKTASPQPKSPIINQKQVINFPHFLFFPAWLGAGPNCWGGTAIM